MIVARSDYPVKRACAKRSPCSATWKSARWCRWSPRHPVRNSAAAGRRQGVAIMCCSAWAGSAPEARLEPVGAPDRRIRRPKPTVKGGPGGQVRRAARRLHQRARSAQTRRPAPGRRAGPFPGSIRPSWKKAAAGMCSPGGRHRRPGRVWQPRHRRQDPGGRNYARRTKVPYLGLCLGMQLMVVEFARDVLNNERGQLDRVRPLHPHPVIDLMPDQRDITDMGGTMRLGLYPCHLQPGTSPPKPTAKPVVQERHRHRFEFNNATATAFEKNGMRFSGLSPDGRWWRSPSWPTTPSWWARSSTLNSSRAPTARTRCSCASCRRSASAPGLPSRKRVKKLIITPG
jgi:hypothetical protein